MRRVMYRERYEEAETRLLDQFLKPDDVIVEAGAALGFVGLLCARIVGVQNITMIEANRDLEPEIWHNFEINGFDPPDIRIGVAAAASDGIVDFHIAKQFWSSSVVERGVTLRTDRLETIGLNDLFREKRATIFICDIEGGEFTLFDGLDLSGLRLIIMEVHAKLATDDMMAALREKIAAQGFTLIQVVENDVCVYARD